MKAFLELVVAKLSQPYKDRGKHKKSIEALLALVGYSIGLGNLWRFSYLLGLYGVTFLIPYGVFLVCVGVPLYLLELALGQYISLGPIHVFTFMCPLLKGIGWGMLLSLVLVVVYYNVVIAWAVYYIGLLFSDTSRLPWSPCTNQSPTEGCRSSQYKEEELYHAAKNFFSDEVMGGKQGSDGEYDINWPLVACLGVAWLLVALCVAGGLRTRGKVLYFTVIYPYIMLTFLYFFNYKYTYEKQDFLDVVQNSFNSTLLTQREIWRDAASQLFYSLGTGFGVITTLSSYNTLTHNLIRDGFLVCLLDTVTSVVCGYVFFSLQESHAHTFTNFEPDTTHVFTISAVILARQDSSLWAILFFTMIFALGFNSQLVMVEAVTTSLFDQFMCLQRCPLAVVSLTCAFLFLLGVPICARGQLGIAIFEFLDSYTSSHSLFIIAGLQVVLVTYCYGFDKMMDGMRKEMRLWVPPLLHGYLYLAWRYLVPLFIMALLVMSLGHDYERISSLDIWSAHQGAEAGTHLFNTPIWGQVIAFAPTVLLICFILHSCFTRQSLKATPKFCPEYHRKEPRRDPHLPNVWFQVDSESVNNTITMDPMRSSQY